jgi:hypothetical protein
LTGVSLQCPLRIIFFCTEREISAKIRPVRDFETLYLKHEALKKERKKLNYNIFKRALFCCKRLLGKAGNRHDIMYNKAITLVKNLSIENLMKLILKFQQLKEYCLNNVENTKVIKTRLVKQISPSHKKVMYNFTFLDILVHYLPSVVRK